MENAVTIDMPIECSHLCAGLLQRAAVICGHGNTEITVQLRATAPGVNILEHSIYTRDVLKL